MALLLQDHRSHHLKQEAIRGEKEWLFSFSTGANPPPPETGDNKRREGVALFLQEHKSHHLKLEAIRGEKEWLFFFRSKGATT